MKLNSDVVLKNFIPAIRVFVAKQLANEHNFSQMEIADMLGITQAAVSKYLSGNYSSTIKTIEKNPKLVQVSKKIVGKIVYTKKQQKVGEVCDVCKNYSGRCLYMHFLTALSESLREEI